MARGRPNWWVILAVSLALMALLTATSGQRHPAQVGPTAKSVLASGEPGNVRGTPKGHGTRHPGTTAPAPGATTTAPGATGVPATVAAGPRPALLVTGAGGTAEGSHSVATPTTTPPTTTTPTTSPPTTTTTTATSPAPAGHTQSEGYLDPPAQTSESFWFDGTASTVQVAVEWSGSTYLTLAVSCPGSSQSAGGTAAMSTLVPGAAGSCTATVAEPTSESVAVSFTITIGPAGA